jgi:transcriptional regulator with XRE-family HTH domain
MDVRGISQVELSEMLSLSQAQISRFMSGERALSLAVILQLANITGIPAGRLSNSPKTSRILKMLGKQSNEHDETLRNNVGIA